jgi:hypothetical protein
MGIVVAAAEVSVSYARTVSQSIAPSGIASTAAVGVPYMTGGGSAYGWTEFTASVDTLQIHVSNDGDDDTGDGSIGNPYATIGRGVDDLRNGYPDWLLLEKDSEWTESVQFDGLSGRNATERMRFGAYGTGPRPVWKYPYSAFGNGAIHCESSGGSYIAITDIRFEPGTGGGPGSSWTDRAISWRSGDYLLVEGCYFEGCWQGCNPEYGDGHRVRRNVFYNLARGAVYQTQGDSLLVEENVMYQIGSAPTDATIWYGVYCQGPDSGGLSANPIVRRNIITDTTQGVQFRYGGTGDDNLFAHAGFAALLKGGSGTLSDNVVLDGRFPDRELTWGLTVEDGATDSTVSGNVVANTAATTSSDPTGIWVGKNGGTVSGPTLSDNIVYDWGGTGISLVGPAPGQLSGITIAGTDIYNSDPGDGNPLLAYDYASVAGEITSGGNRFSHAIATTSWFDLAGTTGDLDDYKFAVGDTTSVTFTPDYSNASGATIGGYMASLGEGSTHAEFMTAAIGQSKDNWQDKYTAHTANEWLRAQFDVSSEQSISPDGIASTAAVGAPTLTYDHELEPTGIASTASVGTPTLLPTIGVEPTGIASATAIGTPALSATYDLQPTGIESAAAVGAPIVALDLDQVFSVEGIASTAAVGAPGLSATAGVAPSGIASAAALGSPSVESDYEIEPTGIASQAAVGVPAVIRQQFIAPGGIASTAALGTPTLTLAYDIQPTGLASTAALGAPAVTLENEINPFGIGSTVAFGVPAFGQQIKPTGIASTVAFGVPDLGGLIHGFHQACSNAIREKFYTEVELTTELADAVQYDNAPAVVLAPFDTNPRGTHANVRVLWETGEVLQVTDAVYYRAEGELSIMLRTPPELGDQELLGLCDTISAAFRGTTVQTDDGGMPGQQSISGEVYDEADPQDVDGWTPESNPVLDTMLEDPSVHFRAPRVLRRGLQKGDPGWPVGGWYVVEVSIPFYADDSFMRPDRTLPATVSDWESAANIVRLRFHTNVATPSSLTTVYDNATHTQAEDQWARFTVLPGLSDRTDSVGTYTLPGLAIAQMFVPVGTGDADALALADTVYQEFRAAVDAGVSFQVPTVRSVGRSGEWWQVNVACPFTAYQHS